jgi:hypothetical protein
MNRPQRSLVPKESDDDYLLMTVRVMMMMIFVLGKKSINLINDSAHRILSRQSICATFPSKPWRDPFLICTLYNDT